MTSVLGVIYSLPFVIGALVGAIGMKLYQRAVCRHLDKTHPLPVGRKRHAPEISRVWLGGLISLGVLGYVLLQVDQTERHYLSLGDEMRRCQAELQQNLIDRAAITTENDALSKQQRDLFVELDELQGVWLTRLITPPPDIAVLPPTDQRRQDYGITVTRGYNERASKLRAEARAIADRQVQLQVERDQRKYPPPTCGVDQAK